MVNERKIIGNAKLQELSEHISLEAHVKRYRFARPYAHGRVLDCACGVGYGTHLISESPDVRIVVGLDSDPQSIVIAKAEYPGDKTVFICEDLRTFTDPAGFDVLVCIETIEHLEEPCDLRDLAMRNHIGALILSFPAFKSTHTNPFHRHDITLNDVQAIFSPAYSISGTYDYLREVWFVFLNRSN